MRSGRSLYLDGIETPILVAVTKRELVGTFGDGVEIQCYVKLRDVIAQFGSGRDGDLRSQISIEYLDIVRTRFGSNRQNHGDLHHATSQS